MNAKFNCVLVAAIGLWGGGRLLRILPQAGHTRKKAM